MKLNMRWTGIRPLIQHNARLVDDQDPIVIRIKEINQLKGKKLTDAHKEERAHLEWTGGLYWTDGVGVVIPSDNVEACIKQGAQKCRNGKEVQATIFCEEVEYRLNYSGRSTDKDALYNDSNKRFQLRKSVVINKRRVMRVRPMFPTGWSFELCVNYDEKIIDEKNLIQACHDAGAVVGFCDWRPKFGRFLVEVLK